MLPKYLYKYANYFIENKNINNMNQTKNIIVNDQLFFSHRNGLNDPYEIRFVTVNPDDNSILNPAVYDGPERQFEEWYKQYFGNIGILSLSAQNDNMIMFSHYANKHKGICLQFDTTKDEIFTNASPVNYRNSIPYINYKDYWDFVSNRDKDYSKFDVIFFTKHKDWIYEEEWRILHQLEANKKEYLYKFNSEALTGIIFGLDTEHDVKEEIRNLISSKRHEIKLFEAKLKKDSYGLIIKPL